MAIISSSSSVFIFRFERAMLGSASLAAPDLTDFSGYLFFDLPAEAVCSPADSCGAAAYSVCCFCCRSRADCCIIVRGLWPD